MTKADIINEISRRTGIEKIDSQKVIEVFMETVKDSMIHGKNIYLRGFGSFILKKRKQKKARNITQNTTIIVPEHYIPVFKPSQAFVDKVKKNIK